MRTQHIHHASRLDLETNRRIELCPIVFIAAVVIFLTMFCSDSYAHDAGKHDHSSTAPVVMDPLVVTADRIDDYVQNHPGQVVILKKKEITRRNMLSVTEALQSMPGVDIKESAGLGSRISIRGSGSSGGVLVLLNGRPLNSSQYGGTDLSTIPVEIVRSITVFKPSVPVWLGPGGSEGAINIVTGDTENNDTDKRRWTRFRMDGGSYGLFEGSVSHRITTDAANLSATAAGKHRDGKRTNSERDSGNFSLHYDTDLVDGQKLEIDGRYHVSEYGSAGPTDNPTPDARQEYQKGSLDGRLNGIISSSWDYGFNIYSDIVDLEDRSQNGTVSSLDDIKWGLKGETNWYDTDDLWELRISGILERDDVDHTLTGTHHRITTGLGIQADRHWEKITGTLGLRGDHTTDFDINPGFSCGVSFEPINQWIIKLNGGYRVKIPTFGQLYQPSHGSIDQVRGNPDLEEERIWFYDAGIEYRPDKTHLFQLSLFRSDIDDPIVYFRGEDRIYRPVNADRSWRHGFEATLKYALNPELTMDLNMIVQDSENCDTDKELPYTPQIKCKATLQYAMATPGTRLEVTVRYNGRQYSEAENRSSQRIDNYTTVTVKIIQPFKIKTTQAEWFLTVDNLFDADYEIHYAYPDDGIRFTTGLNLTF
jgi:iron complex outermembrane receptor protein